MNHIDMLESDPHRGSKTVARSENTIIHPCRGCKPELCNRYAVEDFNSPFILQYWIPYRNQRQLIVKYSGSSIKTK